MSSAAKASLTGRSGPGTESRTPTGSLRESASPFQGEDGSLPDLLPQHPADV
jgi:hypothetical protein